MIPLAWPSRMIHGGKRCAEAFRIHDFRPMPPEWSSTNARGRRGAAEGHRDAGDRCTSLQPAPDLISMSAERPRIWIGARTAAPSRSEQPAYRSRLSRNIARKLPESRPSRAFDGMRIANFRFEPLILRAAARKYPHGCSGPWPCGLQGPNNTSAPISAGRGPRSGVPGVNVIGDQRP